MTIFERILDDGDVEDSVMACLQNWLPTYLSEVERQHNLDEGFYQRPRSWRVRNDMEKWPEEQLPAIIVISTGLADNPVREGAGKHRAPWSIGIAAVVTSKDHLATRRMAYRYAAAIRAVMVQRQSLDLALDESVRGVTWIDGRNNELPPENDRTIFASRQVFAVEVGDVVTQGAGPVAPDPKPDPEEPYDDWPIVPDREHVENTITKEPIGG